MMFYYYAIRQILSSSYVHDSEIRLDTMRYAGSCSIALMAWSVVKTACARNA